MNTSTFYIIYRLSCIYFLDLYSRLHFQMNTLRFVLVASNCFLSFAFSFLTDTARIDRSQNHDSIQIDILIAALFYNEIRLKFAPIRQRQRIDKRGCWYDRAYRLGAIFLFSQIFYLSYFIKHVPGGRVPYRESSLVPRNFILAPFPTATSTK